MTRRKPPRRKWQVNLWDNDHPVIKIVNGKYEGLVLRRDYASEPSARRGIRSLARCHPDARMAVLTEYEFRGFAWFCSKSAEQIRINRPAE